MTQRGVGHSKPNHVVTLPENFRVDVERPDFVTGGTPTGPGFCRRSSITIKRVSVLSSPSLRSLLHYNKSQKDILVYTGLERYTMLYLSLNDYKVQVIFVYP